MTVVSHATSRLHLQAQRANGLLAPFALEVITPWMHLIATLQACGERVPALEDWDLHVEDICGLIEAGLVLPSQQLLQEPRFHAILAEYVAASRAASIQAADWVTQATQMEFTALLASCDDLRIAYEAGGPFLPYLHAVLNLRAHDWMTTTTLLAVQQ